MTPQAERPVRRRSLGVVGALCALLAGCDESGEFSLFEPPAEAEAAADDPTTSTRLVERDVEAPEVFQVTDMGLWDGRPSLGGVWVAHADVEDPERVIIRNTANGQFVIGALFRREREVPGPAIQVSSDAAGALGMLAGAPQQLNVTALRRETAPKPETEVPSDQALVAPDAVEETPLDPIEGAAAAIDAAEAEAQEAAAADTADADPVAPAPAQASSLARPFIQIGIFSVEQNARNTATAMRQAGMIPTVKRQSTSGKTFWRVIVGPAADAAERSALLRKIKDIGFTDAYAVTD